MFFGFRHFSSIVSPFIFMSAPILVGTVTLFAWESGNNLILVMKRGIAFLERNGHRR